MSWALTGIQPHAPLWGGDALDQAHELRPRLGIVLENAQHAAGENAAVLLFDAAHLHAEMIGLDDDAHADGFQVLVQTLSDLRGHPLLHLEAPAVQLDQARQLAEADQPAARDVADMYPAEEGQQVMLAERVHLDVLDDDHVFVGLGEGGIAEDVIDRHAVAAREELEALLDPLGCVAKALARGVLAEQDQLVAHQRLHRDGIAEAVVGLGHGPIMRSARVRPPLMTFIGSAGNSRMYACIAIQSAATEMVWKSGPR